MAGSSLRERDASRKREERQKDRIVIVPPCADRARREGLEADDEAWLRYYFGTESEAEDPFWYEFTSTQKAMIRAIHAAIVNGGDQALAAPRGEGKTTLFERLLLKHTLQGVLSFSVLFAATGTLAETSLDAIKTAIEDNPLLLADYPEVCVPVVGLENTPNRAHYQIVTGKRHDNDEPYEMASSKFSWCGKEIIFPKVPGSPSAGAIIATRGLDSAVRGLKKKGKRPQLAGIDDPDTEETASSEEQAKKLEARIDKAIGGLGGQQRSIARVMLTTLQNRTCVSYKFTDPAQKPTWKGKRFRFLVTPPERTDLWEEYVQMRAADMQDYAGGKTDDQHCRRAHKFYLDRREAMDAGAEVSNPHRYNGEKLEDGSQVEVSALQRYYNEVSRLGAEAVATEFDNDPPEETGLVESGITAHRIQRQVNGYERKVIPPGCVKLTCGIDCRKTALHWVVRAWRADGTGYTIDYGVAEVHGTVYGSEEGLDVALERAILACIEERKAADYHTSDGEVLTISRILVDAGWRTPAVYRACRRAGLGVQAVMGIGHSAGCVQARFSDIERRSRNKKPGDGWFLSRKSNLWVVMADADRWKAWEHDRWMTSPDKPGSMSLFGFPGEGRTLSADEKAHHAYARHVTNEIEVEEPYRGAIRRRWKAKSDNNHWLDASYYSDVAANIEGIRLKAYSLDEDGQVEGMEDVLPGEEQPLSLAEMANRARSVGMRYG